MIDRTSYSLVVAATVVGVCLQLFFLSRGFYSIGWDESGRILDARDWAVHGIFRTNAWLPFYRVIVGLGLTVYPDLVLTPRFITFLFGLASIPMAGWLAYDSKTAGQPSWRSSSVRSFPSAWFSVWRRSPTSC